MLVGRRARYTIIRRNPRLLLGCSRLWLYSDMEQVHYAHSCIHLGLGAAGPVASNKANKGKTRP